MDFQACREQAGLTIEQIAAEFRAPLDLVARWEDGATKVPDHILSTLNLIASFKSGPTPLQPSEDSVSMHKPLRHETVGICDPVPFETKRQSSIDVISNDDHEIDQKGDATVRNRRKQGGVATSSVIHSAHVGDNSELFPRILSLHVPQGSVVADLTYGRGVFWRRVPESDYRLLKSDLKLGQCWTRLPYDDASIDAVVFDPPYMEGLYRKAHHELAGSGSHSSFQRAYSNGKTTNNQRKYHDAVLEAYLSVLPEVKRILKSGGKFIVKCQDEVSANRQKLTHVELIWAFEHYGFYCKDLFVLLRRNAPIISRLIKQEHARKNHSYFLVFQRQDHRPRLDYSNFASWLRDDVG